MRGVRAPRATWRRREKSTGVWYCLSMGTIARALSEPVRTGHTISANISLEPYEISCCCLAAGGPAAEGEGASRITLRFLRVDTWHPGEPQLSGEALMALPIPLIGTSGDDHGAAPPPPPPPLLEESRLHGGGEARSEPVSEPPVEEHENGEVAPAAPPAPRARRGVVRSGRLPSTCSRLLRLASSACRF